MIYLRITIWHILHNTTGRKPPVIHIRVCVWTVWNVNGHIDHGPHPLCMLLTVPKKLHCTNRDQWRNNLNLRLHLHTIQSIQSDFEAKCKENRWQFIGQKNFTSCKAPFLVPPMPLDSTSMVEVLPIIPGNISAHRFYVWRKKINYNSREALKTQILVSHNSNGTPRIQLLYLSPFVI